MCLRKTAAVVTAVMVATGGQAAMAVPLAASAPASMPAVSASAAAVPASAPLAAAPQAVPSAGLLLADITRLSRQRVLNELQGATSVGGVGLPAGAPGLQAGPLPPALMQPPVALPGAAPAATSESGHAAPKLHFTGVVRGGGTATVMYMSGGIIYSARVGETLSNGWKLVSASDAGVTVSSCRAKGRAGRCRTWTEPMVGLTNEGDAVATERGAL